jgi:4-amino-4-deoxy-L-arabinose transferase-like glycosyltransferase
MNSLEPFRISGKVMASALILLGLCFALRLGTLGKIALTDPSEGRYASIAQLMVQTDNWVTPQTYVAGEIVPFNAKPPLHTWLTAISFKLFGMDEWSARFPSFLAAFLTCLITGYFAKSFFSSEIAVLSCFLLVSSLIFFVISGSCLVDPILMLALAGVTTSAAFVLRDKAGNSPLAGALFFVFLALGFMTKGPVAVALAAATLLPWGIFSKRLNDFKKLPWISGIGIFTVITFPWFWMAEKATPGFLKYFFVNENFLRYITPAYGDIYGSAHTHFYGYIWLLALLAFLPWSPVLLFLLAGAVKNKTVRYKEWFVENPWQAYALFWGLGSILFFTVAKQVSPTYVMPALPGLAIFTAILLSQSKKKNAWKLSIISASAAVLIFSSVTLIFGEAISNAASSKGIVETLHAFDPQAAHAFFIKRIPQSAFFYSHEAQNNKIVFSEVKPGELQNLQWKYMIAKLSELPNLYKELDKVQYKLVKQVGDYALLKQD